MNWEDPASWPPSASSWPTIPGGSVEGTITRIEVVQRSAFGKNEPCLRVELDGDGIQRWCNKRLWRTLGDARIVAGDRVRITRNEDQPNPTGHMPMSTWTVQRLTAPTTPAARPTQQAAPSGPTW